MARLYSNENIPLPVVEKLRQLGHDVLTSLEAGNANRSVPDEQVLAFAAAEGRILLTQNRLHFLRLHKRGQIVHGGILVCTYDPDFSAQAQRIHDLVSAGSDLSNQLVRVNRPD